MSVKESLNRHQEARMFKSNFFEFFSKVHPVVPIVLYGPLVVWSLWWAFHYTTVANVAWTFGVGFVVWTITEYFLHRYLFHLAATTPLRQKIYFFLHGVHHDYPDDYYRLVFPPGASLPLAFLFYGLFTWLLPMAYALGAFAGFSVGYLMYDYLHFASHWVKWNVKFLRDQKRQHMRHHFKNPDLGFGVSFSWWDHVFGTYDDGSETP